MKHELGEMGTEVPEPPSGRHIESLDDITREISDRRLQAEFGESIRSEQSEALHAVPNRMENSAEFEASARRHGIEDTEGLRGFATRPEEPAHVLRTEDVATRIGTEIHEDLHRATHPETLREASQEAASQELYEGVTQYFAEQAADDLHGHRTGEVYPEQVERARELAGEVGEQALRDWYFKHELSDALRQAIERIQR